MIGRISHLLMIPFIEFNWIEQLSRLQQLQLQLQMEKKMNDFSFLNFLTKWVSRDFLNGNGMGNENPLPQLPEVGIFSESS